MSSTRISSSRTEFTLRGGGISEPAPLEIVMVGTAANWHFTATNARVNLEHPYPFNLTEAGD